MKRVWLLAGAVACLACGSGNQEEAEHPIVGMAPFDLNCPRHMLRYHRLNETTWGVWGCGRRVKYVKVCQTAWNPYFGIKERECNWLRN